MDGFVCPDSLRPAAELQPLAQIQNQRLKQQLSKQKRHSLQRRQTVGEVNL